MRTVTLTLFQWFLSVVVVGVAINLASAYLKPRVDDLLARFSSRSQAAVARRRAEAERLLQDPHEELLYAMNMHRHWPMPFLLIALGLLIGIYYHVERPVPDTLFIDLSFPQQIPRTLLPSVALVVLLFSVLIEMMRLSEHVNVLKELKRLKDLRAAEAAATPQQPAPPAT